MRPWRLGSVVALAVGIGLAGAVGIVQLVPDRTESPSPAPTGAVDAGSAAPVAALPESAGFTAIAGMTEVLTQPISLSLSPEDAARQGLDAGFSSRAGLAQDWVVTSAVAAYGNLHEGLQLPLPIEFSTRHPGPAEVLVRVVQFASAAQAQTLLADADLTHVGAISYTPLPNAVLHGGNAGSIRSPANNGMDEFQFQWSSADRWVEVRVIGFDLDRAPALTIARAAGG